jgi:hypothetical protein
MRPQFQPRTQEFVLHRVVNRAIFILVFASLAALVTGLILIAGRGQ